MTDASVWTRSPARCWVRACRVLAPALPMRGLESDAAYLAGFLGRIGGPVVLVAHSYAGAVISHPAVAAAGAVKALVFIAAFQPDEGEAVGALNGKFPAAC